VAACRFGSPYPDALPTQPGQLAHRAPGLGLPAPPFPLLLLCTALWSVALLFRTPSTNTIYAV
jgi:hypothetical protein